MTARARATFAESFYAQVDPHNELDPAERERRAVAAKKEHYARLQFKSAVARRKAREQAEAAAAAEAELVALEDGEPT
jgi:hypothetical protein